MVIYAGTQGFLDDVPITRVQEFQNTFLQYVDASQAGLRQAIAAKKELTDELNNQLKQALQSFKTTVWKK